MKQNETKFHSKNKVFLCFFIEKSLQNETLKNYQKTVNPLLNTKINIKRNKTKQTILK